MKLDDCFVPRIIIPNSYALVQVGIFMSFLYGFYLFFTTSKPAKRLAHLSIYYGVFFVFVNLVEMLKVVIGDYTCNTVPNSVSGFSFVCVYNFTLWLFDYKRSGKYKTAVHKLLFLTVELLCLFNITATFIGGYHTPRQMLYGALCSVIALTAVSVMCMFIHNAKSIIFVSCAVIVIMFAAKSTVDFPAAMLLFGSCILAMSAYSLRLLKKDLNYIK